MGGAFDPVAFDSAAFDSGVSTAPLAATGGISLGGHVGLLVDDTPPVTTDDAPSTWQAGAVTVHLSATDTQSGVASTHYRQDGGAWQVGTSATFSVWKRGGGAGDHTLDYYSIDRVGNVEETHTVHVRIDLAAPTVSDDALAVTGGTAPVTLTVTAAKSPALSGVGSIHVRIDAGSWVAYPADGANPFEAHVVLGDGGRWTVAYYATNGAGYSTSGYEVVVVDVVAPTTLQASGGLELGGSARLVSLVSGVKALRATGGVTIDGSANLVETRPLRASGGPRLGGSAWLTSAAPGQYTLRATGGLRLGGRARLTRGQYLPPSDIVVVPSHTVKPDLLNLTASLVGFPFNLAQVGDLTIELDTSGGPLGATMTLARPDLNTAPQIGAIFRVTYKSQTIYLGRLERIETDVDTAMGYKLTFGPAMNRLRDRRDFRACFACEEFSEWQRPTTTPKHDFSIDVTTANGGALGAGYIEAQAKWGASYMGSKYPGMSYGSCGVLMWRLYGGVDTADNIHTLSLTYEWNGDIDPALVTTNKLPLYNLFPDPRAMAGGTDSTTWQLEAGDLNGSAGQSPNRGMLEGMTRRANYFNWDWGHAFQGMDAGTASWDCAMAVPTALAAALKQHGGGLWSLGFWTAANRLASTDRAIIICRDQAGDTLSETLIDLPQGEEWVWVERDLSIPADTVEIQWVMNLELDPDGDGWRRLSLPVLTNQGPNAAYYNDGFSEGWAWDGTPNASPSRETDLTVTSKVLAEVAANAGASPIQAVLFAADDPSNPRWFVEYQGDTMLPKVLHTWNAREKQAGTIHVKPGTSGIGLAVMVAGCPYTLTFLQPKAPIPESYGLKVTAYNVNGPTATGDALQAICRWGGFGGGGGAGPLIPQLYLNSLPMDGWDALDAVNTLVGDDYACWDGANIEFGGGGAEHTLNVADPSTVWSPETDNAETYDSVLVTYSDGKQNPRELLVGNAAGITRRDVVAAPAGVESAAAARAVGEAYLAAHGDYELNGTMTVWGDQGHDDALLFRPGDLLTVTGLARAVAGRQKITHVTLNPLTWEAQLSFGVNSKRFDIFMARLAAGVTIKRS